MPAARDDELALQHNAAGKIGSIAVPDDFGMTAEGAGGRTGRIQQDAVEELGGFVGLGIGDNDLGGIAEADGDWC